MYLAAVFCNGHIATGRHHGEAFSNLSEDCQNAEELVSGHVNSDGTFTTDLDHLHKELILVRHAESQWNAQQTENLDSSLTLLGISQAQKTARHLRNGFDCRGFIGFTSPFDRCLLTSMPIRRQTGIRFFVSPRISEQTDFFPDEGVRVPCRNDQYLDIEWNNYFTTVFHREPSGDFLGRLCFFLESLPDRSLIVTHGSVVQTLTAMALGVKVNQIPKWDNSVKNASITHIKDGTVKIS